MISRSILRFVAFGSLVLLGLSAFFAYQIRSGYEQQLAQAERDTARLARAVEEHAFTSFTAVDAALQTVIARFEKQAPADMGRGYVHGVLKETGTAFPQIRNLAVLGPDGRLSHDSRALAPISDDSDRDRFDAHRAADTGLMIGRPYTSPVTGQTLISLSRRLSDADGAFAGVILAVVEPQFLEDFYQVLGVGMRGLVVLIRDDGIILVREPRDAKTLGRSIGDGPLFTQDLVRSSTGVQRVTMRSDGIERIIAYRRLASLPLVVSVGVAVDDA
ncbi:MAG: hypothetical protein HY246_18105, partial [Proteobacteria bacterium]|nr:hypothetical protein [Pseudomonadota bacterium]